MKPKVLVITGPTATGKSALGVHLAKVFNGEIISADSRQVYRGLDIGSAKITRSEMEGIPHFGIDVADPHEIFSVADFKKLATDAIDDIHRRGKLPIMVGGTGMYISSVINNQTLPQVPPDYELRARLEQEHGEVLFKKLEELDRDRAATIDPKNKVRVIRAIEIATIIGNVPLTIPQSSPYDVLIIGLELPKLELQHRIHQRIIARIPELFDEIKNLLTKGISPERLTSFGLEYTYGLAYTQGTLSLEDFTTTLATKTWQFVRRQITWWKKDSRVHSMNPLLNQQKILKLVQDFLSNS